MRWALLLLVVAALAPHGATAQGTVEGGCQAPVLSLPASPQTFTPGQSYSLAFAIENPNAGAVDSVRATLITSAPAGWSVVAAQRELTLGPRNISFDSLAITAPNRGNGEPSGNITLHVTLVCTTGDTLQTSGADALVPVAISTFQAPWPVVLTGFALLAFTVTVLGVRRLRRGVALVPASISHNVAPGRSVKYTFRVENRRGKPQRFTLLAVGVPIGWSLHLALDDVELEPGEDKSLWAVLKAAPDAPIGQEAAITLRLESPRGSRDSVTSTLLAWVSIDERP